MRLWKLCVSRLSGILNLRSRLLGRRPASPLSGTWIRIVCFLHGGVKVCFLASQMQIMLGSPDRFVTHKLGQRLNVNAIDDGPRAEGMAEAVKLGVIRNARLLT